MKVWQLRDFHPEDLESAVRLDELSSTTSEQPAFPLADVVAALASHQPAVVAVVAGRVVGSAVSRVEGERAWVIRLALDPQWRGRGLGSEMLEALEQRLTAGGVRRISALLPREETGTTAFGNSGFSRRDDLCLFEKVEPVTPHDIRVLNALGGAMTPRGLWESVAGMAAEKALIERRIVLPLAEPELATRHGVSPPRAVMLFGPPGTGKTTFARAVASRLQWPFVELMPSRLASESRGMADGLRVAFEQLDRLEHVVAFIDEIEEIAADRSANEGRGVPVVNELLKSLVRFRASPGRLLVCATNSVRSLDQAFLRYGRFDYLLPVGPPDADARAAMWSSLIDRAELDGADVDVPRLVEASDGFTPADIAHAASAVAQMQFERAVDGAGPAQDRTDLYLQVVRSTRPTVTEQMHREFRQDITTSARL